MEREVRIVVASSMSFFVLYAIIVWFLWHTIKISDIVSVIALIVSFSALYIVIVGGWYKMFSEWIGFEQPILMPLFHLDTKGDRCVAGLINEGELPSKSANIRYLIDSEPSDWVPVYPKAGGHVYYPGVKRGTWELPKGFLLPNQFDRKSVIISVETKTYIWPKRKYCTCRTFVSNGHEWSPVLDNDRNTEPYFLRFRRCKNCPFESINNKVVGIDEV